MTRGSTREIAEADYVVELPSGNVIKNRDNARVLVVQADRHQPPRFAPRVTIGRRGILLVFAVGFAAGCLLQLLWTHASTICYARLMW